MNVKLLALGLTMGCAVHGVAVADESNSKVPDFAPRYGYYVADATATNSPAAIAQGQAAASMIEALQVAKTYLDDLDNGHYVESWKKGDPIFQKTISSKEWALALQKARTPLGTVTSRVLKDEKPAKDPAGLPAGNYMVVEYTTSFTNAPSSGELLTLHQGTDGKWRVLTYKVN